MYIIKEIGYCVFSVFFDANTTTTTSANTPETDGENENNTNKNNTKQQLFKTNLNCFSIILPLNEKHNVLVDHYGDTQFLINSFEHIIMEYKVFAQIKPKINRTTSAIENLTQYIKQFCLNLNILKNRGIHSISNYDVTLKNPNRIQVIIFYFYFFIKRSLYHEKIN